MNPIDLAKVNNALESTTPPSWRIDSRESTPRLTPEPEMKLYAYRETALRIEDQLQALAPDRDYRLAISDREYWSYQTDHLLPIFEAETIRASSSTLRGGSVERRLAKSPKPNKKGRELATFLENRLRVLIPGEDVRRSNPNSDYWIRQTQYLLPSLVQERARAQQDIPQSSWHGRLRSRRAVTAGSGFQRPASTRKAKGEQCRPQPLKGSSGIWEGRLRSLKPKGDHVKSKSRSTERSSRRAKWRWKDSHWTNDIIKC